MVEGQPRVVTHEEIKQSHTVSKWLVSPHGCLKFRENDTATAILNALEINQLEGDIRVEHRKRERRLAEEKRKEDAQIAAEKIR